MGEILKLENVSYTYGAGTPFEKTAVKDINLTFNSGDFVAVIGHTGSGKSTLVQHFNALLPPTSGKVYINGEDINQSAATRRAARFACGLVFQYPEYQLFEETVFLDIAYGPKNMGLDEIEVKRRVLNAAEAVGIDALTLEKSPFDLSGGQKRRVAIAGIMAMDPKVLILDEPTAGLDPRGRDEILNKIADYRVEKKSTVILVSHNMEDISRVCSKVLVMKASRVEMFAPVNEVFERSSELCAMGLNVPQVTRIFLSLKEKGFDVPTSIYTPKQACDAVMKLMGGGER